MPRRNHMKHPQRPRLEDRYDTDVCSLPQHPHIDQLIVIPLKTIFRNVDAAPWAYEKKEIHRFDDDCLRFIMHQKEEMPW